jgi:hypothetical protein
MKQESSRLLRWECQSHIASAQKSIDLHIASAQKIIDNPPFVILLFIHLEIDFQDRGQSITDSEQFWRTSMSKKSKCCESYKKKGKACKKCPLFR